MTDPTTPDPVQTPLRNPFRSEADAFRLLVTVGVAAALVIAAAELIGSAAGAALGLVLIALGARIAYRWIRVAVGEREEEPTGPGEPADAPDATHPGG